MTSVSTLDRPIDRIGTTAPRRVESAAARWSRFAPIVTGDAYIASLRNRDVTVYLFGETIEEPVDHPIIRPSINALARTYDLAVEDPDLATAHSDLIDAKVNRFLHIVGSPHDLVMKNRMQRRLGQLTGTCFQRCAGLDTISVLHSITYDIDQSTARCITSAIWSSCGTRSAITSSSAPA